MALQKQGVQLQIGISRGPSLRRMGSVLTFDTASLLNRRQRDRVSIVRTDPADGWYYDGKLSPPEEQKFRELLGRFIDGERSQKEQKVGELLNRCLGVDLSPEGQKFGELLLRYLDGTLPPADLPAFEKQLREDPKSMTEFAEALVMDVQLRDIMKEKHSSGARPTEGTPEGG